MISATANRTTDRPHTDPDSSVLHAAIDLRSFHRASFTDSDADSESTGEDLNGVANGRRSSLKLWRPLSANFSRR